MQAYSIAVPLTVRGQHQVKHIAAAANLAQPALEAVHVLGMHELEQIKRHLPQQHPGTVLEQALKVVNDSALFQWEHWPMYLGPRSGTSNTLRQQLAELRAKHPQRQHFRIGINNGFGSNLGDSMLGATAFRCVAPVLHELLPQVTVDVIMGWTHQQTVADLYHHTPGIDRLVTQTPTLAELGRYQALFNTHNLIKLPRYGQMPVVDWYLWWLGMEPASVPAANKRNQIQIEPDDTARVAELLGPAQGPVIVLNQKASVPLRSAPTAFVQRLARHLLKQWPKARLVVLQDVGLAHERVLNLSAHINTIGRLAALLAQADAIVTPDTYPLHLADATSTPCVGLFTSISASVYPYYPFMQGLHLPKAESLPAWGESKVSTEEWEKIGPQYDAAWAAWPLDEIVQALRDVMQRKRKDGQRHTLPLPAPLPRTAYRLAQPAAPEAKIHWEGAAQVHPEEVDKLLDNLWHVAKQVLVHGDHAALLGAGTGELALPMAERLGVDGRLHAFEPRRHLHQILCANLVAAQQHQTFAHLLLPADVPGSVHATKALWADDEYQSLQASNQLVQEPVLTLPLDTWNLPHCRLLAIVPPVSALPALKGAKQTLQRLRPIVAVGGHLNDLQQLVRPWLEAQGYQVRISQSKGHNPLNLALLLGEPVASST